MSDIRPYFPLLWDGLLTTVLVAVLSIIGAIVVAVVLGTLRAGRSRPARQASSVGVETLRGVSVIIWLFWLFYALPAIPGGPEIAPFALCVIVLSAVVGAYGAEVVRAGIASLPKGQLDAAHALGLSPTRTVTRVILPQAASQIVPGFSSLAIDTVKGTSIISFVGVHDLFYAADTVRITVANQTVPVYILTLATYGVLCLVAAGFFAALEYALPMGRANRAIRGRSPVHGTPTKLEVT